jgi:hypothetical protein
MVLKLVPKSRPSRPVLTDYQADAFTARVAHSTSVESAIVAATRRIVRHHFRSAAIYNEGGALVVTLKRTGTGLVIHAQRRGSV